VFVADSRAIVIQKHQCFTNGVFVRCINMMKRSFQRDEKEFLRNEKEFLRDEKEFLRDEKEFLHHTND
jgi:hypothetical protein